MDFALTEEQEMLRRSVREFAEAEIKPYVMVYDETQEFPRVLVKKAAAQGYYGVLFPEELGGAGLGYIEYVLIVEELSRVDGSIGISVAAHNSLCTNHVFACGSDAQRARYVPKLASGEWIGAWSLTEPTAGSDAGGTKTTAREAPGGGWILNGSKTFTTHGSVGDLTIVFAVTDPGRAQKGISAFAIEKGAPGFRPGKKENKMGLRASDTAEVIMDDCRVGADALVGRRGEGFVDAMRILDGGRISIAALALGMARGAYDAAIRYAKQREQFGKPIAEFDLIRKKLGEIATQTFVAESMAFRTAGLLDARARAIDPGDPQYQKKMIDAIEEHAIEASIIKVFGSEMLHATADETLQIFGGAGYIEDYPIERVSRDARINRIFEGTNEINRLLVPGTMLKRALGGRLGLMGLVGEVRQELADPIKIDRRIPDGPLGRERKKCDFAKRAIAYGASLGVQKYMQQISEKQELLGVLADCLILTFGMDSAISRTLQLVAAKGEAGSQIPIAMTQLFVAKAHEQVFDMLREMMMWMSQEEEWGREMRDINSYYNLDRVNTFSLRRRVARHVIEAGGYAL